MQAYGFATHECSQLVVHNLNHQLPRLNGRKNVHAQCLLLYRIGESLGHLIVHVGIEQGSAHVFKGFGHVDFGDFPFTFNYFKRPFKSVAKIFKHLSVLSF